MAPRPRPRGAPQPSAVDARATTISLIPGHAADADPRAISNWDVNIDSYAGKDGRLIRSWNVRDMLVQAYKDLLGSGGGGGGGDGTRWFHGDGPPNSVLGAKPGDYYLDQVSGDLYQMDSTQSFALATAPQTEDGTYQVTTLTPTNVSTSQSGVISLI